MFLQPSIQPLGRLKALYNLPPLTALFILTPIRLLLEAFYPCRNYAQRLLTHISTTVYSQVLIDIAELTGTSWRERKCPNFETVPNGDSNPGSLDCESGVLPLSYMYRVI